MGGGGRSDRFPEPEIAKMLAYHRLTKSDLSPTVSSRFVFKGDSQIDAQNVFLSLFLPPKEHKVLNRNLT